MLYELRKLSIEQWWMLLVLVLSMLLSFLFGYVVFRYMEVELCKSPIEIARDSY